MTERLWTVRELCDYLHVDPDWVYQRSRFNEIPGLVRISERKLRFIPELVRAWVESQSQLEGTSDEAQ